MQSGGGTPRALLLHNAWLRRIALALMAVFTPSSAVPSCYNSVNTRTDGGSGLVSALNTRLGRARVGKEGRPSCTVMLEELSGLPRRPADEWFVNQNSIMHYEIRAGPAAKAQSIYQEVPAPPQASAGPQIICCLHSEICSGFSIRLAASLYRVADPAIVVCRYDCEYLSGCSCRAAQISYSRARREDRCGPLHR